MLLMSLTLPVMATNDKSSGGITWEKVDNDTVKADLPARPLMIQTPTLRNMRIRTSFVSP